MMFSLTAEEIEVLKLSCQVAATCLAFSLIPALAVSWVLARKEFFGKSLFETFIFLPLVLPPVVPGYLLLQVFGGNGMLGKYLEPFGLNFAFNWKGAVLASAVMGFPLLVQVLTTTPMRSVLVSHIFLQEHFWCHLYKACLEKW